MHDALFPPEDHRILAVHHLIKACKSMHVIFAVFVLSLACQGCTPQRGCGGDIHNWDDVPRTPIGILRTQVANNTFPRIGTIEIKPLQDGKNFKITGHGMEAYVLSGGESMWYFALTAEGPQEPRPRAGQIRFDLELICDSETLEVTSFSSAPLDEVSRPWQPGNELLQDMEVEVEAWFVANRLDNGELEAAIVIRSRTAGPAIGMNRRLERFGGAEYPTAVSSWIASYEQAPPAFLYAARTMLGLEGRNAPGNEFAYRIFRHIWVPR